MRLWWVGDFRWVVNWPAVFLETIFSRRLVFSMQYHCTM